MKFLLDAHLPPSLCGVFQRAGHDAVHTASLPAANATQDKFLNQLAESEQRVVVTKDSDFYFSHQLHGKPARLLLVRAGNLRLRALLKLFEEHLPEIVAALENNSLVEIDRVRITVHK